MTIIIVDYVFNVVATAIAGAIDFPYYKVSNDLYLHNQMSDHLVLYTKRNLRKIQWGFIARIS